MKKIILIKMLLIIGIFLHAQTDPVISSEEACVGNIIHVDYDPVNFNHASISFNGNYLIESEDYNTKKITILSVNADAVSKEEMYIYFYYDIGKTKRVNCIVYHEVPDQQYIQGGTGFCSMDDDATFKLEPKQYLSYFKWSLTPSTSGSMTVLPNDRSILVNWNENFYGEANIEVKYGNVCGQKTSVLPIDIYKLNDKLNTPSGASSLCINSDNTIYTANEGLQVDNYIWMITPYGVGTIIGDKYGKEIEVEWATDYVGYAYISVAGSNGCGQGPFSDPKKITINDLPYKNWILTNGNILADTICENSEDMLFELSSSNSGVNNIIWNVFPSEAGELSGDMNGAIIDFENEFFGEAIITASVYNECGVMISHNHDILVKANPNAPIVDLEENYCQDVNTILSVKNNYNNYITEWYNKNTQKIGEGDELKLIVSKSNDSLKVKFTDKYKCISQSYLKLNVNEKVISKFDINNSNIESGEKIIFYNKSENAINYKWNFGDGFESIEEAPMHNYYNYGEYSVQLISYNENNCSDTLIKEKLISVSDLISTSIVKKRNLGILIYPNPVKDLLYIDTKEYDFDNDINISIINSLGQIIMDKKINPGIVNEISVSEVKTGIYLLKIKVNNIEKTQKLIIE